MRLRLGECNGVEESAGRQFADFGRYHAWNAHALCFRRLPLQAKTRLDTHHKNVDAVVGYYKDIMVKVGALVNARLAWGAA